MQMIYRQICPRNITVSQVVRWITNPPVKLIKCYFVLCAPQYKTNHMDVFMM